MTGLRHPRTALLAAFASAAGLGLTGVMAYLVPVAKVRDSATLQGFVALNQPRVTGLLGHVAHLADPRPYAVIGLGLAALAFLRRRARVGVAILFLLFLTGATTESLKQLLAHPRLSDWLGNGQIAAASWPSGHATASMTLGLCAVLAVPPVLRPTVAAIGALFAISVSYSILALGWHFPSDVIGGFFVASMWTLVAVAIVEALPRREGAPDGRRLQASAEGLSAFGPMVIGAGAVSVVVAAWVARPRAASSFALERPWFVLGAVGIAALATALAAGLARGVRA
jgi:membrane-associated phospholipid phosphatase